MHPRESLHGCDRVIALAVKDSMFFHSRHWAMSVVGQVDVIPKHDDDPSLLIYDGFISPNIQVPVTFPQKKCSILKHAKPEFHQSSLDRTKLEKGKMS